MNEAAGLGARGAFGRLESQDELVGFVSGVLQDERVLEKDRPAGFAHRAQATPVREPMTSASTAMRTATPLRT